ncbi:hypothetical protein ACHAXT_007138 [Thalassiosira profunda]
MRSLQSLHLHLLLLSAAHQRQPGCHALAQTPRGTIVSRRSDGRSESFSLDGFDEDGDGASDGASDGAHKRKRSERFSGIHPSATRRRVRAALQSTFLPNSTGGGNLEALRQSGYLRYIMYDNLQDLSTSLRSVLATQRILEGVGVGRSGATALSATLNFLIRDGCGMIASLLFTSYAARGFRRNVKRWRFFADVMVDVGITLEIIAPSLREGLFLPLLCLGNVCKALCGVAAGACGGALQMHWAVRLMGTEEGLSEVAAKSGAQRTVMGGIGLVSAALTAKWLGGSDVKVAIGLYCALTLVHLIANYKSLKLVALDWLNGWRLHLVVHEFLDCLDSSKGGKMDASTIAVSNPTEASRKEPLLFLPEWRSLQSAMYPIHMGVSFNKLARLSHRSASLVQSRMTKKSGLESGNYVLVVGDAEGGKHSIYISFFANSSNSEKAKAYLHGCLVRRALVSLQSGPGSKGDIVEKAEEAGERELATLWPIFEHCVSEAGWLLDKTECSTEGYELYLE